MALETTTCLKCGGHGVVVLELWERDGPAGSFMRPFRGGDDAARRWHQCQNCDGAGVLPVWHRAEVWERVAAAGIVLPEPLRAEGDLDAEDIPARQELDV